MCGLGEEWIEPRRTMSICISDSLKVLNKSRRWVIKEIT
jgi:hypothetical protein